MVKVENELPSYESVKHECIGLISFKNYRVHCELGAVYSLLSNRWLLQGAKGVGDKSSYQLTKIKRDDGESVHAYLHEMVMAASLGVYIRSWRDEKLFGNKLEIEHLDRNPKNNAIKNLVLLDRKSQYKPDVLKDMSQRGKLSKQLAIKIREDFNRFTGKKVEFYKAQAEKYGTCARSIQNICLGVSFKSVS